MAMLKVKRDPKLGPLARRLRSEGWRTSVRVKSHVHGLLEGDVFLCIAHKDGLDAIPIEVGYSAARTGALSAKEKASLLRVGLRPAGTKAVEESIRASTKAYLALLGESWSVEEAADHLQVNESRIRQRLGASPPSLYGVKLADGWRLPKAQFTEEGEVPGWGEVVGALDAELDPLSVIGWFTAPNADLALEGSATRWSPRDWLRGRHPARAVVKLAASL